MAGPGIGVPLREPLIQAQLEDIDFWLRSVAPKVDGTLGDWSFWLGETTALGFQSETSEWHPFILGFETFAYHHDFSDLNAALAAVYTAEVEDDRAQWLDHVGFYPVCDLVIAAMVSRPSRLINLMLGYVGLEMARRFGGWVDVDGIVWPPTHHMPWKPESAFPDPAFEKEPLPGRVLTFYHNEGQARKPYSQLLDVEAFEAWLRHSQFYLIK